MLAVRDSVTIHFYGAVGAVSPRLIEYERMCVPFPPTLQSDRRTKAATSRSIVYQAGFWLASGKTDAPRTRRDRGRKEEPRETVAGYSQAVCRPAAANPTDPVEKTSAVFDAARGAASGAVLRVAIASKGSENPNGGVLRSAKREIGPRSTLRHLFSHVSWQTLHGGPTSRPSISARRLTPRGPIAMTRGHVKGACREADLSTTQEAPQAHPWISQAHADARWAPDPPAPSPQGPQAALGDGRQEVTFFPPTDAGDGG
jgi:hypothetical protein